MVPDLFAWIVEVFVMLTHVLQRPLQDDVAIFTALPVSAPWDDVLTQKLVHDQSFLGAVSVIGDPISA
jgi:hypothetical protein